MMAQFVILISFCVILAGCSKSPEQKEKRPAFMEPSYQKGQGIAKRIQSKPKKARDAMGKMNKAIATQEDMYKEMEALTD